MVAVGALGIVSLAVLSINSISMKSATSANTYHQADTFRKYITSVIRNKTAWQKTIAANATMACQLTPPGTANCATYDTPNFPSLVLGNPGAPARPFLVKDQANNTVYDATSPTRGFDMGGRVCNTFGVTPYTPNNNCPFRLELSWKIVCPASPTACTMNNGAGVEVEGYVIYKPLVVAAKTKELAFNPMVYNIKTRVNEDSGSAEIGSGTIDFIPKWLTSTTLTDSKMYQHGSDIVVNAHPTNPVALTPALSSLTLYQDSDAGADGFTVVPNTGYGSTDYFRIYNDGAGYARFIFNGGQGISIHQTGVTATRGGLVVGSGANYYSSPLGVPANGMIVAGNVGIGTNTTSSRLGVSGGVAVGTYGAATAAPTNGMIVSGAVGIGTSSIGAQETFVVSPAAGYGARIGGTGNTGLVSLLVSSVGTTQVPLAANGIASQTANLFEARITGTPVFSVTPVGNTTTAGSATATAFYYSSDEHLKKDIETSPGLDIIRKLKGVFFRWIKNDEPAAGVIAQDVERVLPTAVKTNPATGLKSVDGAQLMGPMIEAIKELDERVKKLENENMELKKQLRANGEKKNK